VGRGARAAAPEKAAPVRIGGGAYTYELVPNWVQLSWGMEFGYGCDVIVDELDCVDVTSRSTNLSVAILERTDALCSNQVTV
jgi:hypothetical protein